MRITPIIAVLLAIPLAGCNHGHSVKWYSVHPHALLKELKSCGLSKQTPACQRARKAQTQDILTPPPPLTGKGAGY